MTGIVIIGQGTFQVPPNRADPAFPPMAAACLQAVGTLEGIPELHSPGLIDADGQNTAGRLIEILNGLSGNERIAGTNAFLLKAELAKGEAEHGH